MKCSGKSLRFWAQAFTLIELLVVVAIIALLISILLPSLNKARDQAKAAVCSTRLQQFGRALYVYAGEFKAFPPTDPWRPFPPLPGPGRNTNLDSQKFDPPHGYLAMHAMGIKPNLGASAGLLGRALFPWDFKFELEEDLWEGFTCPSMNRRIFDMRWWQASGAGPNEWQGYYYQYCAAYLTNRFLRCGTDRGANPLSPSLFDPHPVDNMFGSAALYLELGGRVGSFWVQATNPDQVTTPADVFYMADTFDENLEAEGIMDGYNAGQWRWTGPSSALNSSNIFDLPTMPLSIRHLGKSNVLWMDGHADRANQVPRHRDGRRVVSVTWGDIIEEYNLGNQHHLAPTGRRVVTTR
ncbi:MAG: type II secretion system protein [Phycisphaerae bacterium]